MWCKAWSAATSECPVLSAGCVHFGLQARQEPKLLQLIDDVYEACIEQVRQVTGRGYCHVVIISAAI